MTTSNDTNVDNHRLKENYVILKQPQEVITTHLNKNIIFDIVTDKISRETVNDEGDHSSHQTNNMVNVE